jgi:hypothetical protein
LNHNQQKKICDDSKRTRKKKNNILQIKIKEKKLLSSQFSLNLTKELKNYNTVIGKNNDVS